MTQEDLASLSGLSQAYISKVEAGAFPNVAAALMIAQVLGSSVEEIWVIGADA